MIKRIEASEEAMQLISKIKKEFVEIMFYLSGGCCEGTQPMCMEKKTSILKTNDVYIGKLENVEFWVDKNSFEYLEFTHLHLYVIDGAHFEYSLEFDFDKTFKLKYRIFDDSEIDDLEEVKYNRI